VHCLADNNSHSQSATSQDGQNVATKNGYGFSIDPDGVEGGPYTDSLA
jgi:hypothetical protein